MGDFTVLPGKTYAEFFLYFYYRILKFEELKCYFLWIDSSCFIASCFCPDFFFFLSPIYYVCIFHLRGFPWIISWYLRLKYWKVKPDTTGTLQVVFIKNLLFFPLGLSSSERWCPQVSFVECIWFLAFWQLLEREGVEWFPVQYAAVYVASPFQYGSSPPDFAFPAYPCLSGLTSPESNFQFPGEWENSNRNMVLVIKTWNVFLKKKNPFSKYRVQSSLHG